jgi:outer membrane protein OmpA-like peptidoglycan-associated protein
MIIDEAQRLNYPLLEQVRLLSNIVSTNKRQLNIFLVGQNELDDLLRDERARATRQRIVVRHKLRPLDIEEVTAYIHHRMEVAGADRVIFLPDAIEAVALQTDGIPRAINVICDQALLKCYEDNAKLIDAEIVNNCPAARELPQPSGTEEPTESSPEDTLESEDLDRDAPPAGDSQKKTPWRFRQAVVASLTVATLVAGLVALMHFFMGSGTSGRREALEITPKLLLDRPDRPDRQVTPLPGKNGSAADNGGNGRPEKLESHAGKSAQAMPGGTPGSVPASGKEARTNPGGGKIKGRTARTPGPDDVKRDDAGEAALTEQDPTVEAGTADRVAPHAADIPKKGGRLILYFKFDSSELTVASADDLKAFLSELSLGSGKSFRVNGYTDASGDYWYNKKLSQRRANAVRDLLVEGGANYADIVAVGMGSDDPQAGSGLKDDPRKGRRVEVILIDSR